MVEVSSGKIIYSESVDCQGSIENVITVSIPLVAQKVSRHITGSPADTVTALAPQVPSPPSLATEAHDPKQSSRRRVLLNGSASGATPFRTERLEPGRYLLRLDMPTYKLWMIPLPLQRDKLKRGILARTYGFVARFGCRGPPGLPENRAFPKTGGASRERHQAAQKPCGKNHVLRAVAGIRCCRHLL